MIATRTSSLSRRLFQYRSLVVALLVLVKFPKFAIAGDQRFIRLKENPNYCLTASNPRVNSAVTIGRCDQRNRFQKWRFDHNGLWCTMDQPNLCVIVPNPSRPREGDRLVLTRRRSNRDHYWFHNSKGNDELQIRSSNALCVTYNRRSPAAGTPAILSPCNRSLSQAWHLLYDITSKPGDNWELIRMHKRRNLCVGVEVVRRNEVDANQNLFVTGCNKRDRTQQWRFTDCGTWIPRLNTGLCVSINNARDGEFLRLRPCDRAEHKRWDHNENDRSIAPTRKRSLCVARTNSNRLRVFSNCFNAVQRGGRPPNDREWDFIEAG